MSASCSDRHLDSGLGRWKSLCRGSETAALRIEPPAASLGCPSHFIVLRIADGAPSAVFPVSTPRRRQCPIGALCCPPRPPPATQHHCINHEHTPGHGKRTGREMAF